MLEGLSKSSPNSYWGVSEHKMLKENLPTNDTHRTVPNSDVLINGANVLGKYEMKHRHSYRKKNLESSNAKWTGVITSSKFI